jgi:nitrile hydratase accessory protein
LTPPETPRSSKPTDEAVFDAPWEAEAFALAVHLNERGVFAWDEWTRTLAEEIHGPDAEVRSYYQHWIAALERLVAEKKLTGRAELEARHDAWLRATQATPHGQPILLENDPLARRDAGR